VQGHVTGALSDRGCHGESPAPRNRRSRM